ncbi:DUF1002 domain-containing protein [Geomicrobium sp. JCM 19039]|uniref:DUF1002 domain-containing protein n=1 Tax=Geomicrobium sp. JCM 19039 TaxID=1460636 RepID=UPI00045F309C|nr:DUF1002 domain-containing protein [Geomicrobium sp. JCM 19039]GAK11499.1 extracellular protein [Geomicrobium sp. JCM 19039]
MLVGAGLFAPLTANADAGPGDVIVTLGEDLSPAQRESLLSEMGTDESANIIEVSNAEEHEYLGDYIPAGQIGSNALSSAKITIGEPGSGVDVETNNINWVAEGMYANALVTAGVEDADIYVTAPSPISGTGALTGILKAYDAEAEGLSEERMQVANQEMVETGNLGDRIGIEEATELVTQIKETIAEENVENEDDLRALIQRIASDLGIELTEEELDGLVSLFLRMQDLDIDWNQLGDQVNQIRDNIGDWLEQEETQNFLQSVMDFFSELIDTVAGWFGGGESESGS